LCIKRKNRPVDASDEAYAINKEEATKDVAYSARFNSTSFIKGVIS
jgi:hypothetical protein